MGIKGAVKYGGIPIEASPSRSSSISKLHTGDAGSGFPVPDYLHKSPWLAGPVMKGVPSLKGISAITGVGGRTRQGPSLHF